MVASLGSAGEAAAADCPNQAYRVGASQVLPDCRAYEMVSSPEANGRFLQGFFSLHPFEAFPTELISPTGGSVLYMTDNGPLPAPGEGTGVLDAYQAVRGASGWTTVRRVSPGGAQAVMPDWNGSSPDHGYSFFNAAPVGGSSGGNLADKADADYLGKPDGSFESTGVGSLGTEPLAEGRLITEGGDHVIFTTGGVWCFRAGGACKKEQLEPDAPEAGTAAVYDRSANGPTHVISLLPGTDEPPGAGKDAEYQGASKNARSVAFKIEGVLYVRVDNDLEDERTEKVTGADPVFAGLSDDGRYLFYVAGGENGAIYRFDTETEINAEVNPGAAGEVVNVSADGSHVYFISEEEINGKGAAGEPNLYAWSGGAAEIVATVLPSDLSHTSGGRVGEPALTNWTDFAVNPDKYGAGNAFGIGPGADSSRTTPNGRVLVFESRAELTSYENAGHTEIYRYDDITKALTCVSCSGSVEPAEADARLENLSFLFTPVVVNNLSSDGKRVFFETSEALVARDTDGINDIYEWQEEGDSESRDLISTGQSVAFPYSAPTLETEYLFLPKPNTILGITPEGNDVAFMALEPLVAGAGSGGSAAIYDARVDGGFPVAPVTNPCSEGGCHPASLPSPTLESAVPSQGLHGSGNIKARSKHCPRAKAKKRRRAGKCSRHHKRHKVSHGRGRIGAAASGSSAPQEVSLASAVGAPAPASVSSAAAPELEDSRSGRAASATSEFAEFGIESVKAETSLAQAGQHPDFTASFVLNHHLSGGAAVASARLDETSVLLPPGLVGNPNAMLKCQTGEFTAGGNCPIDSQVGIAKLLLYGQKPSEAGTEPIFNLSVPHPDREIARFGLYAGFFPVYIDVALRTAGDYGVTATVHGSPAQQPLISASTTIWGNPADSSHDAQRLTVSEARECSTACEAPEGKRPSGIPAGQREAFLTNPSPCQSNEVGFRVSSYQLPGQVFDKSAPLPGTTACQGLPFAPTFSAEPTSHAAGAPTGLKTDLVIPQHLGAEESATATMREARVTLPAGMQIAAGAANWIDTCSEAQVGFHEEVDAVCPGGSKLGTATITSPALPEPIQGALYQRSPTPGHQFGLWLVADALGMHVKLPGELVPDKQSGRLTAVFASLPQVPVEEIEFDVWGGPRAPLQNPVSCGTYATDFSFAPYSQDPAATGQASMTIDEGCAEPFDPKLNAGVTDPLAGHFSPFIFDLTRDDGSQALRGFELHLPDGELAKLAGVPLCGDAAAVSGDCPSGSRIGSLVAASGPGPEPLWLPQPGKVVPTIYLGGPYHGAPYSIVSEVPAQAGPFDLGTLMVRSALAVDPETARATVKADPLPQFFEGVGIAYRRLHAVIDRPGFSLNPTDCHETAVTSDVISTQGTVTHPAARFEVDGCRALQFKPKLSLKLHGGSRRAGYPALTAVLQARNGDANIATASVGLPHSEFLAQEHIGTICTRVQFAAKKCPKGAVYGKAKVWTPLLDEPLSGPVYLRSSDHPLPDLVARLDGQLEIDLVGRIDSIHGGIRTTFEAVPDAPVSKFVLRMRGGPKGLLTNSTDICRSSHRATVAMRAQNGRAVRLSPPLESSSCAGKKRGRNKDHR